MDKRIIEISWESLWRIAIMVAAVAVVFIARDVLVTLFMAIVISAGLTPFVDFFEKRGVPRLLGTLTVYIFFILIIGLVLYAVLPIAAAEFGNLFSNIFELTQSFFDFASTEEFLKGINDKFVSLKNLLTPGAGFSFFEFASNIFGGVVLVVSVAVISFYLCVSRDGVEKFLRAVLPETSEEKILRIFNHSKKRISYWLQTQILLSVIVGFISFIGLWILGVKHAFILGLLAGIFEIVPFVGPVFSGSIAVLIGLSESFMLGIYVVILFVVIQQLESHILIPSLMRRTVGLHPVIVLTALMIGVKLAGFVGIILAIPVTVIAQEFLEDWVLFKARRRQQKIV